MTEYFAGGTVDKNPPANGGNMGLIPGPGRILTASELLLEKAMAPHSSTLAWKIPWMEEPGGLQSM